MLLSHRSTIGRTLLLHLPHMSRNSSRFWVSSLLPLCMLVHVSLATLQSPCDTPRLLTWDNAQCSGTPDSGPLLEPNVCPGTCATVSPPTSTPSFIYKCGSQGLDMHNMYMSNCSGPYFSAKMATGRCLALFGHSMAVTCTPNDPVLPPLIGSLSPNNGTIMPSFPCPKPYTCSPGVPFVTRYTDLNCRGRASSSEIFARNQLNGCYGDFFLGFQLRMTCDNGLLYFRWFAAGCRQPDFLTVAWPSNVCINDLSSEESFVMSCGSPAATNTQHVDVQLASIPRTVTHKSTSNSILPKLFPKLFPSALQPLL